MENKGLIVESKELLDAYQVTGKDFPVPDSDKGVESGPKGLVMQSDKRKAPRLNASDGYGPSVKGKEGKAFPATTAPSTGSSEKVAFGATVSLVDGQVSPSVKKQRI